MPIISIALKRMNVWDQRDSLQNAQCQQLPYTHMSACLIGNETMLGHYALTLAARKGVVYAEWHTFLKVAGSGRRPCELMHHLLLLERGAVAGV